MEKYYLTIGACDPNLVHFFFPLADAIYLDLYVVKLIETYFLFLAFSVVSSAICHLRNFLLLELVTFFCHSYYLLL